MRAAFYQQFGDNSVITIGELPDPKVGPGEVLVEVRCAGVNPVDWKVMAGGLDPLMNAYFPVVPGWDVSGVVKAVGLDTPEYAVGDAVIAYARKDVLAGGTFAELVSAPVRTLARKPASLGFEEAAGLPLAGLTAYQLLTRLSTKPGETVLVHAAAGGVGSLAVQVARALGARVIGTASERNHEFVRSLGAEPVGYGEGLADRVRALAPTGVDVVADFVGGVLADTLAVLAPGGRHASVADPAVAGSGGSYIWVRPDPDDLATLAQWADQGDLIVPLDAVFGLDQVADAFALSQAGHARGKIVIRVSDGTATTAG